MLGRATLLSGWILPSRRTQVSLPVVSVTALGLAAVAVVLVVVIRIEAERYRSTRMLG